MRINFQSIRSTTGLIGVSVLALSACGGADAIACGDLPQPSADAAVLVLTDGLSDSLGTTIDQLTRSPGTAFEADAIDFDAPSGTVIVAVYDEAGAVTEHASFNLMALGSDEVRAKGRASRSAECLRSATGTLAPVSEVPAIAPASELQRDSGPNLLAALVYADALLDATGATETAVLVHGFSRSFNDGFEPAISDLSESSRPGVLQTLLDAGAVPTLGHPVVFVDPAEGVESGLVRPDIRSFAEMLAREMGTSRQPVVTIFS